MGNLKNIFKTLNRPEKIFIFSFFVISIFTILIELLSIALIPLIFSSLLDFDTGNVFLDKISNLISENANNKFIFILILIVLIFFFKALFLYGAKIFEVVTYKRIRLRLSELLLNNNLNLDLLEIQKDTPATKFWKMSIIMNLVSVIDSIVHLTRNLGYFIVIFLFLVYYGGSNILFMFFALVFFTFIFYLFFSKLIKKTGEIANTAKKERVNSLQNIMNGVKEIFIFNKFKYFSDEYKEYNIKFEKHAQKNILIANIPIQFIEFFGIFFICLFSLQLYSSGIASEKLLAIISVLAYGGIRLIAILKISMTHFNNYKSNTYVISVILNELKKKIVRQKNNITYKVLDKNTDSLINISNLNFGYSKEKIIFKNLNLLFKVNKIYGIFGESGSGKSTFLDLLLGLYEIEKNKIYINCLINEVGYVPQESYLINTSIKKNIAFGVLEKDISYDRMEKASKQAGIYEFINNLPEKFETELNIFGSNISVGQKQRIGIARTLYFNPKIILLDEPTSALDSETEGKFMNTLNEIKKDRLIIMTTHKKNIINKIDTILTIKNNIISNY